MNGELAPEDSADTGVETSTELLMRKLGKTAAGFSLSAWLEPRVSISDSMLEMSHFLVFRHLGFAKGGVKDDVVVDKLKIIRMLILKHFM